MNSMNHILIGTVVYEYIKDKYGIVLDKQSFLKGNTCPDHGISFLRPHRVRYCNKMIQRKTARLCNSGFKIIGGRASKRFGILCHYYADFFCCAHSPQFEGNLKAHVRYENELLHFMEDHYSFFREIDYIGDHSFAESAVEINERMRSLIKEKNIRQADYAMELIGAIQACVELVLSIYLAVLSPLEETVGSYVSRGIA
jgi:hypothetical protein